MAEMALAGGTGFTMTVVPQIANPAAMLFGEDQGRAIVSTSQPDRVRELAAAAQLFSIPVGTTGGDAIAFDLIDRGGEQSGRPRRPPHRARGLSCRRLMEA